MNKIMKMTSAAALAGALALAAVTPGQAENGRNAAAAIGFGAGALVGAAAVNAANNNGYYGNGYYASEPAYYGDYAYEPAPVYEAAPVYESAPVYATRTYYRDGHQMRHVRKCTASPASMSFGEAC
jgi:uncharacterized low-complexity protein